MINYEKVGEKIFSIVKGHNHNLVMFNEEGMETNDASEARRFFVNKPNYMVTLDAENRKIKFNKNRHVTLEEIESVMKQIKNLATANMLKNEIQVFGKEITPKDFAYQAKQFKEANMNDISEASLSRMSGYSKTSYQTLESVKMVVRHRKAVDEDVRGSRSRQISAIFLEQAGERFRFPHNNLAGGRAMARHMYEGGNMQDTIGEYIVETTGNVIKLAEFVRYARSNKLMNEANEDVVKTVKENINTLRAEIKGLTGAKSYATMSETIIAREANVLEEDDTTDLQNMFTVRKFDEKITDTLPLIKRLMDNKQTWRDAILEASQVEIAISEKTELAEQDVFEFENPVQAMGYKVRGIAERIIAESDLSIFVSKVAGKLIEGATISDFEKKVVGNVLENARIREEECVCEGCGEIEESCKCSTKDVVSLISDSFELKMKMLENEDIFEEDNAALRNLKKGREDRKTNVPDYAGAGAGKVREDEGKTADDFKLSTHDELSWEQVKNLKDSSYKRRIIRQKKQADTRRKIDKSYVNQDRKARGSDAEEKYDMDVKFREEEDSTPKKPEGEDCETCGGWGEVSTSGKHWRDISSLDDIVGCPDCKPVTEGEGDTCIRCRKGTMEVGDTMMGAQEKCNRCGYQLQVNEDDWDDEVRRGEAASGATGMGYPDDTAGMDIERPDCQDCDGFGIGLDGESDCYTCNGTGKVDEVDDYDDGQPSDYEEMQDFMGGDDWDQGQFDESIREMQRAAGIKIAEVSDPAAADECSYCKGDGNDPTSIFDEDDCPECGGTGEVE